MNQGDRMGVLTRDGRSRTLIVASLEGDVLKGRLDTQPGREQGPVVEISIADIVRVERKEVSAGKTVLGFGGG